MSAQQRGPTPQKVGDRSQSRRKRKGLRQAGSPESGPALGGSVVGGGALARLGYALRTGSPVRAARRLFYSLCSGRDTPAPPEEVSSAMYVPVGRGSRRRSVRFVRASAAPVPIDPVSYALGRPPPRPRSLVPLLRAESVPWIGYDDRVTGTFLEDPVLRDFRLARERAMAEGRRQLLPSESERFDSDARLCRWFGVWGGMPGAWSLGDNVPPLYRTRIGTYELSRALHYHSKENLSIAAMVHEHLLGLEEFLPPLYE